MALHIAAAAAASELPSCVVALDKALRDQHIDRSGTERFHASEEDKGGAYKSEHIPIEDSYVNLQMLSHIVPLARHGKPIKHSSSGMHLVLPPGILQLSPLHRTNVRQAKSLEELLRLDHVRIDDPNARSQLLVATYIQANLKHIYIIIDGLDEATVEGCNQLMKELTAGTQLDGVRLIVASRPSTVVLSTSPKTTNSTNMWKFWVSMSQMFNIKCGIYPHACQSSQKSGCT